MDKIIEIDHQQEALYENLPYWTSREELNFFAWRDVNTEMKKQWHLPILMLILYFLTLQFLPKFMISRSSPVYLKNFLFWWNIVLSLFSLMELMMTLPTLLFNPIIGFWKHGFSKSLCGHPDSYGNGWSGLALYMFALSKFPELLDTLFIILNKRPVIFLHWWHHWTVLAYSWRLCRLAGSVGIWFCWMNSGVHFLMYGYYACTQYSSEWKKQVRSFGNVITILQIIQMFGGLFVLLTAAYQKTTRFACYTDNVSILFGLFIYSSYLILFINFYIKRWCVFVEKKKC